MKNAATGFNIKALFNHVNWDLHPGKDGFRGALRQLHHTTPGIQHLDSDIVHQFSLRLGLAFVSEQSNGNVCFANNNSELRDEFKQVFSASDILDYTYAIMHSSVYQERYSEVSALQEIPYPNDADIFWALVSLGKQCKKAQLPQTDRNSLTEAIDAYL